MSTNDPNSTCRPSILNRIAVAVSLLVGLRTHDIRALRSLMIKTHSYGSPTKRIVKFIGWALAQMFGIIPNALTTASMSRPVSRTSIWLAAENPLVNHPWTTDLNARLPDETEVVVIGAGFTGSACAYHWSKQRGDMMTVLEMNEAASGASGRNEGLVVMGRYFAYVKGTVLDHFNRTRVYLTPVQRDKLASKFATAYVRSAYKNGDLIEKTVKEEGFDCDYVRDGWAQAQFDDDQSGLKESVRLGLEAGFDDWTTIEPEEVLKFGGMQVENTAGFSKRTGSWHPAKWVWSLLTTALRADNVNLFTRTKVDRVTDNGEHYSVHTNRGTVRAKHVINATESYSALIHPQLRDILHPLQTQAAFAEGGPESIKADAALQAGFGFFGRISNGVIFGSDATRVPFRQAGRNQPSRFITKFLIGEMHRYFGRSEVKITREWSCTAGITDDEFPVVGVLDGKRQYIIGGMCGSGSAVHFNGARHIVQQILGLDGPDDYPGEYFSPTRLLNPQSHIWPSIDD